MTNKRHTTAEAARILGITPRLVRKYCSEGRLGSVIGRDYSITHDDLMRFQKKPRRVGRPKRGKE